MKRKPKPDPPYSYFADEDTDYDLITSVPTDIAETLKYIDEIQRQMEEVKRQQGGYGTDSEPYKPNLQPWDPRDKPKPLKTPRDPLSPLPPKPRFVPKTEADRLQLAELEKAFEALLIRLLTEKKIERGVIDRLHEMVRILNA